MWLAKQGHAVRRLTRTGLQPESVMLDLTADVTDKTWVTALCGCTAIVHCAAHVHRPTETAAEQEFCHRVNAIGTERLLAACVAAGVRRFVLASTIAVYDWTANTGARRENDPVLPATAYARSKLENEVRVQASDCAWSIARLATVHGDGDHANFARLAVALRRKCFVLPGDGRARKSVLPVAKAGELLGRLAIMSEARGIVVNLAAPIAPSLADICAAFDAVYGYGRPRHVPLPLLRFAAWVGNGITKLGGRAPLTSEVLNKLTTETVVDVARMQSLFTDLHWDSFEETLRKSAHYYASTA